MSLLKLFKLSLLPNLISGFTGTLVKALIQKLRFIVALIDDIQDSCSESNSTDGWKWFCPLPLGNFADIAYLKENFKLRLIRYVCTLCAESALGR